jgi:hypothetical protein
MAMNRKKQAPKYWTRTDGEPAGTKGLNDSFSQDQGHEHQGGERGSVHSGHRGEGRGHGAA